MERKLIVFIPILILILGMVCTSCHDNYGIDVSHHNNIDLSTIKGIDFVYIKASEGGKFKDRARHKFYNQAKRAGLKVGFYHYFRTDVSAERQFVNYVEAVKEIQSDLIPVIDVELDGNNLSSPKANERLGQLIALMKNIYGVKPIIYVGHSQALRLPSIYPCKWWLRTVSYGHWPVTTINQYKYINKGTLDYNSCNLQNILLEP